MNSSSTNSLKNKSVLVTGGSGSFGQRCVQRLLDDGLVKRVVIFSRGELRQWQMRQKLSNHPNFERLRFFIGDVRERRRLKLAMRDIDFVIHAAAMKHIDACEYNPTEAVQTNIIGTENVVLAALESGIKRTVMVSTDKAVSPANLYGSTKLAAEKIMISGNNLAGSMDSRFALVRYGNVIGSSGSVVPLFTAKIAKQQALPITDEKMTRFLMRIDHGVRLVLDTLSWAKGGEIVIPKAPSALIVDIARALHPLGKAAPIELIGIRAGEKMHESLMSADETAHVYEDSDRYICIPSSQTFSRTDPFKKFRNLPRCYNTGYNSLDNPHYLKGEPLKKALKEGLADFADHAE